MQYSITITGKNTDNQTSSNVSMKYPTTISGKNRDNQAAAMLVCNTLQP